MGLKITKDEVQKIEMYLNVIINEAENLGSGNTAHKAASIKGYAEGVKKILNKPKYKCYTCEDTGKVEDPAYPSGCNKYITCPFCKK